MVKREALRPAINNACRDCIFDPYQEGTWRRQVELCTNPNCALFSVRPRPIATLHSGKSKSLILSPEFGLKGPVSEQLSGGAE